LKLKGNQARKALIEWWYQDVREQIDNEGKSNAEKDEARDWLEEAKEEMDNIINVPNQAIRVR
jgi:hypothetical protein